MIGRNAAVHNPDMRAAVARGGGARRGAARPLSRCIVASGSVQNENLWPSGRILDAARGAV